MLFSCLMSCFARRFTVQCNVRQGFILARLFSLSRLLWRSACVRWSCEAASGQDTIVIGIASTSFWQSLASWIWSSLSWICPSFVPSESVGRSGWSALFAISVQFGNYGWCWHPSSFLCRLCFGPVVFWCSSSICSRCSSLWMSQNTFTPIRLLNPAFWITMDPSWIPCCRCSWRSRAVLIGSCFWSHFRAWANSTHISMCFTCFSQCLASWMCWPPFSSKPPRASLTSIGIMWSRTSWLRRMHARRRWQRCSMRRRTARVSRKWTGVEGGEKPSTEFSEIHRLEIDWVNEMREWAMNLSFEEIIEKFVKHKHITCGLFMPK